MIAETSTIETGAAGGLLVVIAQGLFSLGAKMFAKTSAKNGHADAALCRQHGERLATLEADFKSVNRRLDNHGEKLEEVRQQTTEILSEIKRRR